MGSDLFKRHFFCLSSEMDRAGKGEDNPAFDDFVNGASSVDNANERTPVNTYTKPV